MYESIKDFSEQFKWSPETVNGDKLGKYSKYILAGMGGSHLAGGIINIAWPEIDLWIHRDYGLPIIPKDEKEKTLIIVSSYSGNTEEVISCLEEALAEGQDVAVVADSGRLLEIAKEKGLPYIDLPATGIQPRMATGFSLLAIMKLIGDEGKLREISELGGLLYPLNYEEQGRDLADKLKNWIPIIYSSARNKPLAYIWKITMNETGKSMAFFNAFSELNHNELEGFDMLERNPELAGKFKFIFLKDTADHERVGTRMEVMKKILEKKGFEVIWLDLTDSNRLLRIFGSIMLAAWTSLNIAETAGFDPAAVPTIEEFKRSI
ncbi:MAG: SIS domain-containing protein [bacterium]